MSTFETVILNALDNLARRIKDLENKAPQYPPVQSSVGNGNLALTGSYQTVTGITLTLEPSTYFITALVDVVFDPVDAGQTVNLKLNIGGVALAAYGVKSSSGTLQFTWYVTITASSTVILQVMKSGGAGTTYINCANSNLLVIETQ